MYKIEFSDGLHAAGYWKKTKRGKAWMDRTHLHQHLSQYAYDYRRLAKINDPDRSQWPHVNTLDRFVEYFQGAVIHDYVNQQKTDFLEYLDYYLKNHYRKGKK